jgi:UDP-N-acetylmuramoyl-tripeptide--D-alanyl-D-alanine ligase
VNKTLDLQQLQQRLNGKLQSGFTTGQQLKISRVSTDTRSIQPGDLFVALRGERFDAHNFLQQAADCGAAAALVEEFSTQVSIPQVQVDDTIRALGELAKISHEDYTSHLVALTGSCGKTTVKAMLTSILSEVGAVHATAGNLNNHIGVPQTLLAMPADCQLAVIEMGANGLGEIDYLASLAQPTVALVNNVMAAHLEGFGSEEVVASEKAMIYRHLQAGGTAVINLDEPYADGWMQWLQSNRSDLKLLRFSVENPAADLYASEIKLDSLGCYGFRLNSGKGEIDVQLPLMGRQNVANALAAAACAMACDASLEQISRGLAKVTPVKGRLLPLVGPGTSVIIDDSYNANPGSVMAAARVLTDLQDTGRETVLVLGDLAELGEDGDAALQQLGLDLKALGIGRLLTVGNNSQHASDAFYGINTTAHGQHFKTQGELITHLQQHITDDTVVLVKGSRSARTECIVQALTSGGEQ